MMNRFGLIGMGALALAVATVSQARAANIITFDDNANSCGGAVMCSTNGTIGYRGTNPFDLSTISQWFQINTTGVNEIPIQPMAEPNGGAGAFLVTNDTGHTVTSFSLTINDSFWSGTPSVTFCSGSSGPLCDVFQAQKGAAAPSGASETLSGLDLFSCTNPNGASPCTSTAAQASAEFKQGTATYTWNGLNIAPNATFDISFSSWNNAIDSIATPLPAALPLFATGIGGLGLLGWRGSGRRRRSLNPINATEASKGRAIGRPFYFAVRKRNHNM